VIKTLRTRNSSTQRLPSSALTSARGITSGDQPTSTDGAFLLP
jgi:hypothetical protein